MSRHHKQQQQRRRDQCEIVSNSTSGSSGCGGESGINMSTKRNAAPLGNDEVQRQQQHQHLNGHQHVFNGNGAAAGSKRRRPSTPPATTNINHVGGVAKKIKLKQQHGGNIGGSGAAIANARETASSSTRTNYNNNKHVKNNNNNIKVTTANGQYTRKQQTNNEVPSSTTNFTYRDTLSPTSPSLPANVDVVCISDAESIGDDLEPTEHIVDSDLETNEEMPTSSKPATAHSTAITAASTPGYTVPTSNSAPLDLENEAHQRDLESVTDLRSYVKLYSDERVSLNDFKIIRVLGTGAYGRVFLVRKLTRHDAGRLYAMKVLNKITVVQKRKTAEHTKTERVVLEAVQRSPFLVGLHYAFQSSSKLYLVLDFANGGELFTHLYNAERFEEPRVRVYIAEVVLALEQLHQLGIIYRDIKLENILLDGDGHIVLSDFGLSKILTAENEYRAHSFCGTLEYMAPEIIRTGPPGHDSAVDWWSVGVLTFELLTGASPFATSDGQSQQSEISRRIQKEQPLIPSSFSTSARDFVLKMLEKNPKRRLGGNHRDASEIKDHPFFRGINWQELRAKRRTAPFQPSLASEDDVQYFSYEFTEQLPEDPECDAPPSHIQLFRGYTYVAPEHLEQMRRDNRCNIEYCNQGLQNIPTRPDDLELGSRKAFGAFGTCHIVVDNNIDTIFLAKVIPLSKFRASEVDALTSCAMDKNNHKNIVNYIETFRDKCEVWIITENLSGDELAVRLQHTKLDEQSCREIFGQLVSAVRHIHAKHFIHGDLKPENVMFVNCEENNNSVKLVDFGNACYNYGFESWQDKPRYTLDYAPPELLTDPNVVTYSPAVDVYCLGATLYTMLVGHAPFRNYQGDCDQSATAQHTLRKRMKKENFNQRSERWVNASPQFKQLVKWCLERNPANRPQLDDLLKSDWLLHGNDYDGVDFIAPPDQEVVDLSEDTMEQPIDSLDTNEMEARAICVQSPQQLLQDFEETAISPTVVTTTRVSDELFTEEPPIMVSSSETWAGKAPKAEPSTLAAFEIARNDEADEPFMFELFDPDYEGTSDFYGFDEQIPPLRLPSEYFVELPLPPLPIDQQLLNGTTHFTNESSVTQMRSAVATVASKQARTRQQCRVERHLVAAQYTTDIQADTKEGLRKLMQALPPPSDEPPIKYQRLATIRKPRSSYISRQRYLSTSDRDPLLGFSKTSSSWRKTRASWRHFCLMLNGVQQVLKHRFKKERRVYASTSIKKEPIDAAYEPPLIFPRPRLPVVRRAKPAPKVPRPPTRVQPERARALRARYVFE
ncbi:chromosomal serine/threonine-protein kinase JIL-1 [Scaptodrosophila lebanonensis]|uniref:non-specific serine/threonine protein kinase n=1 Tax=Drosophila lebanonensis TaxID=7225 RepID=A0A6J2UDU5_DROLE|nr:chromosomal serine/threonine-protein kinase JIL-1 [Scaptodrosophila lebanonensis]XP_030386322.1 chromosomal serine/threonine-protein kinase JIL-1 [Scaptodrosophila lebanonensis]